MKVKISRTMANYIPGSVFAQPGFYFDPQPFKVGTPCWISEKLIGPEHQIDSLQKFVEDPAMPCLYAVGSHQGPARARYFAAYLMEVYRMKHGGNLVWVSLYPSTPEELADGAPWNPQLGKVVPDFLVVEGVEIGSDNLVFEKARDLVATYNCPKVVVSGTLDPFTLSMYMRHPIQYVAHFGATFEKL